MNADCTETVCDNKCSGVHQEEPCAFATGDHITTEAVAVDMGKLVFRISENVFVPGHLEEISLLLVDTLERISGLEFNGSDYARTYYPDGQVNVNVSRDSLYIGEDWYMGLDTNEMGRAMACLPPTDVELSPGDLLIGSSSAMAHELAHILMYRQNEWVHSQLLDEGFAEYTAYLLVREWEENAPEEAFYLDTGDHILLNNEIHSYEKLYEQPLEYWLSNTFEYAGNANYAIGFRFMAYLHQVYGDYTGWITAFADVENEVDRVYFASAAEQQAEILKAVYGEDVLDNFYPWLQENMTQFNCDMYGVTYRDLTAVEKVNLYPTYDAVCRTARITNFTYNDLYINIDCVRQYVEEYKGDDGAGLVLVTSQPVGVNLYHEDGTYTYVTTGGGPEGIPLDNVSYIKLTGEGQLALLEVVGSFSEDTLR